MGYTPNVTGRVPRFRLMDRLRRALLLCEFLESDEEYASYCEFKWTLCKFTCSLVASCLKTEQLAFPSHTDCWTLLEKRDHISLVNPPVSFPSSPMKYVLTRLNGENDFFLVSRSRSYNTSLLRI